MSNPYWEKVRCVGNCLFSLFRVRPIREDLEEQFLDKPFDREKSLILDRAVQLEEQPFQPKEDLGNSNDHDNS